MTFVKYIVMENLKHLDSEVDSAHTHTQVQIITFVMYIVQVHVCDLQPSITQICTYYILLSTHWSFKHQRFQLHSKIIIYRPHNDIQTQAQVVSFHTRIYVLQ